MKKILLTLACLAAGIFAQANLSGKTFSVKLDNGLYVGAEACSDGIFRVKVSPRSQFSESLMERYGIVKGSWEAVKTTESRSGKEWTLSTPSYSLTIDRKTGTIAVKDAKGNPVIREISFLTGKDPLSGTLAGMINEKYASLHVTANDGIIGDDNGKLSKVSNSEISPDGQRSIISIRMEDGERFYGGGSTSREHIQHRGELLRMWTTYQHTEIPMPFMMSSRGWGIFNNTSRKNFFDVGCHSKDQFNIFNTTDEADFFLMMGKGMPAVLDEYTQVTGRSYVLPKWAYGLCFGPNMREDQFDILTDAVMFRQLDIPCDVLWLEPQWMEKRYDFSTQKKWNYDRFSPEPYWVQDQYPKKLFDRLFIGKLRSMGFHLGLWLCENYDLSIPEEDAIALKEGRDTSGKEHWMDHLTNFLDMGVEGFKLDPARTIDNHPDMVYFNGRKDDEMHNINQVLLQKQMVEMGRQHTGKRTWHHYCGGWSGTQHWGAATSGDNGGGKTALFDQLNLGMSGFLNTSCDVMGVEKELEMPSLHFGLFLPWVQINSWFSMMQPQYYPKKEQTIYRNYVKTRYHLLPYIYSLALEASLDGMPIVRSMPLEFPDDRKVDDMVYQYMFGPNLCVGIFSNEIYLPAGNWTDAWTGERIVSKGETITHEYPDTRAGLLFIREGAVIPTQGDIEFIGTEPFRNIVLKVYPHGDSQFTMYEDDGDSYDYQSGSIATTLFECHQNGGDVEIVVNPVKGSYKGMPEERNFQFEIQCDAKPSSVSADGKPVSGWTYSEGMTRFSLGSSDLDKKIKILIRK